MSELHPQSPHDTADTKECEVKCPSGEEPELPARLRALARAADRSRARGSLTTLKLKLGYGTRSIVRLVAVRLGRRWTRSRVSQRLKPKLGVCR